jgi:catechol 2,3-dioxygenase-like lactoylglutathione lyase family enzyme
MRGISGRPAYGVVATADLSRALTFYCDVLGLGVLSRDAFGCFLEAGGTEVRLSIVPEVPPSFGTVLGWRVPDVGAAVAWLAVNEVVVEQVPDIGQDARGIWTGPDGSRLAWFRDPDGNLLSLLESPQR